jgi:hypothetical protein
MDDEDSVAESDEEKELDENFDAEMVEEIETVSENVCDSPLEMECVCVVEFGDPMMKRQMCGSACEQSNVVSVLLVGYTALHREGSSGSRPPIQTGLSFAGWLAAKLMIFPAPERTHARRTPDFLLPTSPTCLAAQKVSATLYGRGVVCSSAVRSFVMFWRSVKRSEQT